MRPRDPASGDPYPLGVAARIVLGILAAECGVIAWSLWARPPIPTGRTDLTILDAIPVLSALWPWLFLAGAVILGSIAVTAWSRGLHIVLSLGGGVHISYGLTSGAVAFINNTGFTGSVLAGALGMFYLLSAMRVARGVL